jgi:hypothetical protein
MTFYFFNFLETQTKIHELQIEVSDLRRMRSEFREPCLSSAFFTAPAEYISRTTNEPPYN